MESPLHQFEVKTLLPLEVAGYDVSFTNSALYMVLSVLGIFALFYLGTRKATVIPGKSQSVLELIVGFVHEMVGEALGPESRTYLPFILSVFLFILFGNLVGMIPYSFTFTSQIILTFGIAMVVFVAVTMIGILKQGFSFLAHFMPAGVPILLAPIIVPIEIISFLSRPISLAIRLFANMMAGHTMMKVFAIFTVLLGAAGISTLLVNVILIGFEFLVACLQAYVFSVLTCLYLKDALEGHAE